MQYSKNRAKGLSVTDDYSEIYESEREAEGERRRGDAYNLINRYEKKGNLNWIDNLDETSLTSVGWYAFTLDNIERTPAQLSWFVDNAENHVPTEGPLPLVLTRPAPDMEVDH
jgi:hypothetical protein